MWWWWVLVWLVSALALYFVNVHWGWHQSSSLGSGRTLFVTAHPDDECMFFSPAILSLTETRPQSVFLLCLSCGNYRKEGPTRVCELFASAKELAIPVENVTVMNSSHFPDDPKAQWDTTRLANVIANHVEALDITALVSFDEYGVSGHANHRALAIATRDMRLPSNCRAFSLDSVNVLRKYLSALDVMPTLLTGLFVHIATPERRRRGLRAMAAHRTQMVWFRKLYLLFSRYMIVNSFTELTDELGLSIS